jgi:hypothetical protein
MQTISSNAVAGVERELDVTDNSFLCSLFHNASIMRICDGALSIENDCFFKPEIKDFKGKSKTRTSATIRVYEGFSGRRSTFEFKI